MAFTTVTFDITQTQFLLDPGEEYTITFDDGMFIDEQYTVNQALDVYTFITQPVVIDAELIYVNTKIKGIKLTFDREINYNNGNIFLYYEDSTLLQTWASSDLSNSWIINLNRTEIELYVTTPGELVDRTFFVILEDDAFYTDDRVLSKSASWADSSIDFQYVGQHLQQLVLGNTDAQTSVTALSVGLSLAPWQYLELAPNNDVYFTSVDASTSYYIQGKYDNVGENGTAYILDSNRDLLYTKTNPGTYDTGYDRFGQNVKINNSYALVSSPTNNSTSGNKTGEAYVYDLTDGSLAYTLTPTSTDSLQYFGEGLAITNDYFIVGAPDESNSTNRGTVSVYNATDGSLAYSLNNPNPDASTLGTEDNYGTYITANDTYLIVSAYLEDDTAANITSEQRSGKVYVYDITNGTLLRTLNNPNNVGDPWQDFFGWSVAIDSGTSTLLAVGAATEDSVNGSYGLTQDNDGVVYIINASTGALIQTIVNPLPNETYGFGQHIEITTDYIIVRSQDMVFWIDKTTYEMKQSKKPDLSGSIRFAANNDYTLINEIDGSTFKNYFFNKI